MKSIKEIAIIKNNARLLLSIKEQIDILKFEEKKLTEELKQYMLEEKLISRGKEKKPFESFLLIEKKESEIIPSEFYKYVTLDTFIKSVSVIKKEACKYVSGDTLKEIALDKKPSYTLKRV